MGQIQRIHPRVTESSLRRAAVGWSISNPTFYRERLRACCIARSHRGWSSSASLPTRNQSVTRQHSARLGPFALAGLLLLLLGTATQPAFAAVFTVTRNEDFVDDGVCDTHFEQAQPSPPIPVGVGTWFYCSLREAVAAANA